MAKPIEERKFVKAIAFENAFQIELKICRLCGARGIAKNPKAEAVGYDAPEHVLAVVEEVLHHRLRAGPKLGMQAPVEIDLEAFNVNGYCIVPVSRAMGNRIAGIVDDCRRRLRMQIKAEHL